MRKLLTLCLLLVPVLAQAQVSAPIKVEVRNEGTSAGRVGSIDCVGAGINCTVSGDVATLSVSGGGGGGGNGVEVSIDLGTDSGLIYTATVTGQAWVTATSFIVCQPFATSADGQTVETYYAAHFTVTASTRVDGVGFDLSIFSPHGATGVFRIHCLGV